MLASARRLPAATADALPAAPGKLRLTGVLTWSVRGDKASLLRLRTASIVRGGQTRKTEQSLMMTLAGDCRDRAAERQGDRRAARSLPGLRVTSGRRSQKGGALVATACASSPERRRQLPTKRAGRFSVKAVRPSRASSVENRIANRSASCTKLAPRSPCSERLVASLA